MLLLPASVYHMYLTDNVSVSEQKQMISIKTNRDICGEDPDTCTAFVIHSKLVGLCPYIIKCIAYLAGC